MSETTGEYRETTRFRPGRSGNPAGRPRGSRNKATLIAEAKLADRTGDIIDVQLERALAGSTAAARFCMERAGAGTKGCIRFELPDTDLATTADVVEAQRCVIRAIAAGEISVRDGERTIVTLDLFKASLEEELVKQRKAAELAAWQVEREAKKAAEAEEEALLAAEEEAAEAAEREAIAATAQTLAEDLALFGIADDEKNREIQAEPPAVPAMDPAPPYLDPTKPPQLPADMGDREARWRYREARDEWMRRFG